MNDVSHIIQFLFSGITTGSIYALIAVSLVIVYKASQLICFAQGEFFVFGALSMITLTSKGLPMPIAFFAAVFISVCIGSLIQQVLIKPIQGSSVGNLIVMTIAISLALRGLALIIWGRESYILNPYTKGEPLFVFGASLQIQVLWIVGITILVLLIIWYFFEKTSLGIAMRACAENPLGASLMGISVQKSALFAWAWGAGIGALAGAVVAPLLFIQYTSGVMPMIKGFIAMSIGGLGSIAGSVMAGFLLGLVESYTIGLISSKFSDTIVFALLMLVLIFRPNGLFSKS
ncbi:MAG TPA: branched-chain amino acid ABC transporter permease [Syntrophorhabdaceae bacterium]|nr:branched-chain amino acid ABC transporter permease [Syntrophorhabdaceae bacterium]HOL06439.1 branched-chain amino acid ABC transporter permease [Syntrophorhabdaceae bacterium]HPP42754.1 branched-chain amino acid ABC transporter permease [Syntrophorhabdaceae bacterium]